MKISWAKGTTISTSIYHCRSLSFWRMSNNQLNEESQSCGEMRRAGLSIANVSDQFCWQPQQPGLQDSPNYFPFEIHLLLLLPAIKVTTLGHLLFVLMKSILNLINSICVCLKFSSNKTQNFYLAAGTIFLTL